MRWLVLLALLFGTGCRATLDVLAGISEASSDYRADAAERAYAQQKQLAAEEREDRRAARRGHIDAERLQHELTAQRRQINAQIEAEVRAELEQDSPLVPGTVVALMPLESTRVDARVTDTVDALLFLELSSANQFRFVARGDVDRAGREITREACAGERCAIEIGHALAAEQVLVPQLFVGEQTCRLSLSLYDLRTETGAWAATVASACDDTSLREAVRGLATRLAAPVVAWRRPLQATTEPPEKPKGPRRQPFHAP